MDYKINSPSPLAIYVFTDNEDVKKKRTLFVNFPSSVEVYSRTLVLERTASGTLVQNDTYQQLAVHEMPFGGQGESGCTS